MMWPFKKRPIPVPSDVPEAQSQRAAASAQLARAERRAPTVAQITGYLAERRLQNHFGESVQITFTRRPT